MVIEAEALKDMDEELVVGLRLRALSSLGRR